MKRAMLCAVLLLAGGIIAIWLSQRALPPEPSYNGKTLSLWLRDLNYSHQPADQIASNAVSQIGTNALPYLGPMLRAHDSKLKLQMISLLRKQSFWKINFTPAKDIQKRASAACRVLHQDAKQYIPELTAMLNTPDRVTAWCGLTALMDVKPRSAWPDLLDSALTNSDPQVRWWSASALGNVIEGSVINALPRTSPKLINCLADPDPNVRQHAAEALVRIEDSETRQTVEEIARGNAANRVNLIHKRGNLQKDARRLEAVLLRYQTNHDPIVRTQAQAALERMKRPNDL